jgi:mRNA-decapping enzyme subunit 2
MSNRNTTPARKDKDSSSTDPYQSAEYLDALEDVHTRFILNLPESELQTADRIFFQLEQAWWFYEDWICDPDPDTKLPRFSTLKPFAQKLFQYSPLLPDLNKFTPMWNEFGNYKRKISNYGCILLSQDCTQVILCRIWNSKTYTFPAGKINQGEDGATAAARETYEETGFDPACDFGLTNEWKDGTATAAPNHDNITWQYPLLERDALVFSEDNGKRRTCYVCHGVPNDFPFAPVARKEVSSVEWHTLDAIPKPSYAVSPFLPQLKRWIKKYRKNNTSGGTTGGDKGMPAGSSHKKQLQKEKSLSRSSSRGSSTGAQPNNNTNKSKSGKNSRNNSRGRDRVIQDDQDALVKAGLAATGDSSGWSEKDMFEVNERLIGRKVDYDGNPHLFSDGSGSQQDPHAFHVVGGGFLNAANANSGAGGGAESGSALAPPPQASKLQPLFRSNKDGSELQPFFSDDGVTPWGDVMAEAIDLQPRPRDVKADSTVGRGGGKNSKKGKEVAPIDHGKALLATIQGNGGGGGKQTSLSGSAAATNDIFLTDAEITARSQAKADQALQAGKNAEAKREKRRLQYEQDMAFIQQWVANLPKPKPSKHFGTFKLDADALLAGTPLAAALQKTR